MNEIFDPWRPETQTSPTSVGTGVRPNNDRRPRTGTSALKLFARARCATRTSSVRPAADGRHRPISAFDHSSQRIPTGQGADHSIFWFSQTDPSAHTDLGHGATCRRLKAIEKSSPPFHDLRKASGDFECVVGVLAGSA